MSRKGLAIWLLLSALALPGADANPSGLPEADRQQILAYLADVISPARLGAAAVFLSGDLAAVRLPADSGNPVVYVLERPAGAAESWHAVARITTAGEVHFGDVILLSPNAILVAAPDTAGAGLGPGATYVFQRHVGGRDRWGLVAKLAPDAFPPPGVVTVHQLSEHGSREASVAPPPAAVTAPPVAVTAPPPSAATPFPPAATAPPPPAAATAVPQAAVTSPPTADAAHEAPEKPALATEETRSGDDGRPASEGGLRYIAVANMREQPRALDLAASLRDKGYASEVHRNYRDFFVVTLARLPLAEAQKIRDEAVAAGDVPRDAYLIVGTGFREKISR